MINGSLLAANIGAMGYFLTDPAYAAGISMLAATSAMSTLMGVSTTRRLLSVLFYGFKRAGHIALTHFEF